MHGDLVLCGQIEELFTALVLSSRDSLDDVKAHAIGSSVCRLLLMPSEVMFSSDKRKYLCKNRCWGGMLGCKRSAKIA